MKSFQQTKAPVLSSLIAAIMLFSVRQLPAQDPPAPVPQAVTELPPVNADEMAEEDRDDLLRGPVHEAYAEQFNSDPVPGLVIPHKPPESVEEVPPELKPNGRQVEWISGYWAWDEDQDDFIWISGIWREVPQGFRWLPGYWTEVEGGFQWVNGTWVSTQTEEIAYLDEAPPETLELGPVGNAPTTEHIWIPGTWMWNETRYAWRPGYWSTGYDNWIWVPARYQWTPRGYYYCNGYWDYPVQRRGVLFAPSHFHRRFRQCRITRFTPQVVVASNLLTVHFWVCPRYRHYYFGDYYNVGFANRGLTPWHQFPRQRRCFDPLYAHYGQRQRSNDFYNQVNAQFNVFVNQPDRRPPIRFRDQDRWARDHRNDFRPDDFLGNRFQNVVEHASRSRDGFQFVRLENQQREQLQQETRRLRDLMDQRREVERSVAQLERMRDRSGERGPNDHNSESRGPKDRGPDSDRKDGDRKDGDRENRDQGRSENGIASKQDENAGQSPGNDVAHDGEPANRPDATLNSEDHASKPVKGADDLVSGLPNGDAIDAEKNDNGRKGRDRLKLDPPVVDGTNADSKLNREIIQDQIGNLEGKLNDRRDRAELNIRDSADHESSPTHGVPAIGDGEGTSPALDAPKPDLPGVDLPKVDLPKVNDAKNDMKNRVPDAQSPGRETAPAGGTGTDNSAKIGDRNDAASDRQSERENPVIRINQPAEGTSSGTDAIKPNGKTGTPGADAARLNQPDSEINKAPRGEGPVSRGIDRDASRERLRLPPATRPGTATGDNSKREVGASEPAEGSGNTGPANTSPGRIGADNSVSGSKDRDIRSRLEAIRNSRSRPDSNKPAATSDPAAGGPVQNPPADVRANRTRGMDRSQNQSAPAGNLINNGAKDAAPREAAKEPSREAAVRNIPPQRDRSPAGGLNSGPQPGSDRATRRESPPKVDSPPAASGRTRGSEPRSNVGNVDENPGGRPSGRVGGDSAAAREPRNSPSMGSPRGGDAGGGGAAGGRGRVSNPSAGPGNPGADAPSGGSARGAGGASGKREAGGTAAGGRRGREKQP